MGQQTPPEQARIERWLAQKPAPVLDAFFADMELSTSQLYLREADRRLDAARLACDRAELAALIVRDPEDDRSAEEIRTAEVDLAIADRELFQAQEHRDLLVAAIDRLKAEHARAQRRLWGASTTIRRGHVPTTRPRTVARPRERRERRTRRWRSSSSSDGDSSGSSSDSDSDPPAVGGAIGAARCRRAAA